MYIICSILVMAGITYLIRALPMTLFQKPIKSVYIRSFLHYVPYAVLGAMTFPHIFYATEKIHYAIVGTVVALVLSYFEKSLTFVAVASVLAVYLCHFFL